MAVNAPLVGLSEEMAAKETVKSRNQVTFWISRNWQVIISEFLSTALLLLLGCMCCIPIDGHSPQPALFGPLGFGLVVLINIQTFGHISGAFMNPSVTLAAMIWGKVSVLLGIAYFIAQCSGAIVGYGILAALSSNATGVCVTQPQEKYTLLQALGYEIIITASLVLINCAVWDPANENKQESNSIKFGLTIAGLSIAAGPLTGASMNPARSLAPAIWNNLWNNHWIYWTGPLVGSVIATILYKVIFLKSTVESNNKFRVVSLKDDFEEKA